MNGIISLTIKKELIKQLNINNNIFNLISKDFNLKLINELIILIYKGDYFIFKRIENNDDERLILSKRGKDPYVSVNLLNFSGIEFLAFSTESCIELITTNSNITNAFKLSFNEATGLTKVWEFTNGLVLEFGGGKVYKFVRDPFKGVEKIEGCEEMIKGIVWSCKQNNYFVASKADGYKLYSYELNNWNSCLDGEELPLKFKKQNKLDSIKPRNGPLNIKLELNLPIQSSEKFQNFAITDKLVFLQTHHKLTIMDRLAINIVGVRDSKDFCLLHDTSLKVFEDEIILLTVGIDGSEVFMEMLDLAKIGTMESSMSSRSAIPIFKLNTHSNFSPNNLIKSVSISSPCQTLVITLVSDSKKLLKLDYITELEKVGEFLKILKIFDINLYYVLMEEVISIGVEKNINGGGEDANNLSITELVGILLTSRVDFSEDYGTDNCENFNDIEFSNFNLLQKLLPSANKINLKSSENFKFIQLAKFYSEKFNIKKLYSQKQLNLVKLIRLYNKFEGIKLFPVVIKLSGGESCQCETQFLSYIENWLNKDLRGYSGFVCHELEVKESELEDNFGLGIVSRGLSKYLDLLARLKAISKSGSSEDFLQFTNDTIALNPQLVTILNLKYNTNLATSLNHQLKDFQTLQLTRLKPSQFKHQRDIEYSYLQQSINFFQTTDTLDLSQIFDNWELNPQNELNLIQKFKKLYIGALYCKLMMSNENLRLKMASKVKFGNKLVDFGNNGDGNWIKFYEGFGNYRNEVDSSGSDWFVGGKLFRLGILNELELDLSDYYSLLVKKHPGIESGLILGLSAQYLSSKSSRLTKLFSLYLPPLQNNLLISEFNKFKNDVENLGSIHYLTQCSALIGIGMLYAGTKPNIQFLYPVLDRLGLICKAFTIEESSKQNSIILGAGVCIGLTQLDEGLKSEKDWDLLSIKLIEIWKEASNRPASNLEDIEFQLIGVLVALGLKHSFKGFVNVELNNIFSITDFLDYTPLVLFIKGLFHFSTLLNQGVKVENLLLPPQLKEIRGLAPRLRIFYWKLKSSQWFATGLHYMCSYNPKLTNYLWIEVQAHKHLLQKSKSQSFTKFSLEYIYLLVALALINLGKTNSNLVTELLTLKASIELNSIEYKLIDITLALVYLGSDNPKTLKNTNLVKGLLILSYFPITCDQGECMVFHELFRFLVKLGVDNRFLGVRDSIAGDLVKFNVNLELFGEPDDGSSNVLVLETPCQLPDQRFIKSIELLPPKGVSVKNLESCSLSTTSTGSIKALFDFKTFNINLNNWTFAKLSPPSSLEPFTSYSNWDSLLLASNNNDGDSDRIDYFKLKNILEGKTASYEQLKLLAIRLKFSRDKTSKFYRFLLICSAKVNDWFNNGNEDNEGNFCNVELLKTEFQKSLLL